MSKHSSAVTELSQRAIVSCIIFALVISWSTACHAHEPVKSGPNIEERIAISQIQGAGHISAYKDQLVRLRASVVTHVMPRGFFIQDLYPDALLETSEAVYIYTGKTAKVKPGDWVLVEGVVSEYYPGGSDGQSLSITEIISPAYQIISSNIVLPEPVILGKNGRRLPDQVIDDDTHGRVGFSGKYDPQSDGVDFFESLEGMLVQVNDALIVGPTNQYGELVVVGDRGEYAGAFTPRGGLYLREDDFNPERIILSSDSVIMPEVNIGDYFTSPIQGVIHYRFGKYVLEVIIPIEPVSGNLSKERRTYQEEDELSILSWNVENLNSISEQYRIERLADDIVNRLNAPDILCLQEIQDNDGYSDSGETRADLTYESLVEHIVRQGGPLYAFHDIAPENNQDGGALGANIRVGFLYRTDRGIQFPVGEEGISTIGVELLESAKGLTLSMNPGRISPVHPAYERSRKSLIAEFWFRNKKVFIINNHFQSRNEDSPLYGIYQPPIEISREKREAQAAIIHQCVSDMLFMDDEVDIVVLGDFNDFPFSSPLKILSGNELVNLTAQLPEAEQYTYVYEGNSQMLDQILVSRHLFDAAHIKVDVVHTQAEFAEMIQITDHDPVVLTFRYSSKDE